MTEKQKAAFSIVTLQKSIQESLKKPQAKQSCLSFEYKLLLLYSAQFGIYIMPQLNNIQTWHGIVFVRYGLFKDGKFKFKITFDNFPRRPPKVYFMSEVWHPMVDFQTGLLDLGEQTDKQWNYGTDHLIFTVIQHVRLIFIDVKKYEIGNSLNKKAAEQYKNNVDEFFLKVRQCVQNSKNQIFTNYNDTSLKFMPYNQKHKKIREGLSQICQQQGTSLQQKKKKFMKMLKEQK